MDGAGITGLRLFCSALDQPNHVQEKVIEFPGSFGNWGERKNCPNEKWADLIYLQFATSDSDHQGVVRIKMSCRGSELGKAGGGREYAGQTEDPTEWQQGLAQGDLTSMEEAVREAPL